METTANHPPVEEAEDDLLTQISKLMTTLGQGISLGSLRGMDDTQLEAVYGLAHHHYGQGRHEVAERLLTFYVIHQHIDRKSTRLNSSHT